MRIITGLLGLALLCALSVGVGPRGLSAAEGDGSWRLPFRLTSLFSRGGTDVTTYECDGCGQIHAPEMKCTQRVTVPDCVVGKKRVYDSETRYEYVSVPEVRYRLKEMWVTKEIPAPGCKPVCKSQDGQNCFGTERWDKHNEGTACETHCRSIESKLEKADCKYCESEEAETTIKVRYKTCVKVPYTVYRRVKRPICLKIPCDEEVEVPIIRHECHDPNCSGCDLCSGANCGSCRGQGCGACGR